MLPAANSLSKSQLRVPEVFIEGFYGFLKLYKKVNLAVRLRLRMDNYL